MRPQDKVFTNSNIISYILSFLSLDDYLRSTGLVSRRFHHLTQYALSTNLARFSEHSQGLFLINACLKVLDQKLNNDEKANLSHQLKNYLSNQCESMANRTIALTIIVLMGLQDQVAIENKYHHQLHIALNITQISRPILAEIILVLIQRTQHKYHVECSNSLINKIEDWRMDQLSIEKYFYRKALPYLSNKQDKLAPTANYNHLDIDAEIDRMNKKIKKEKEALFNVIDLTINISARLNSRQAKQLFYIYLEFFNNYPNNNIILQKILFSSITRKLNAIDTKEIFLDLISTRLALKIELLARLFEWMYTTLQPDAAAMIRIAIIEKLPLTDIIGRPRPLKSGWVKEGINDVLKSGITMKLTLAIPLFANSFSPDQAEIIFLTYFNFISEAKDDRFDDRFDNEVITFTTLAIKLFTPTLTRTIKAEIIKDLFLDLSDLVRNVSTYPKKRRVALRILCAIWNKLNNAQIKQVMPVLISMANANNNDWDNEIATVLVAYSLKLTVKRFTDLLNCINNNSHLTGILIARVIIKQGMTLSNDCAIKYLPILVDAIINSSMTDDTRLIIDLQMQALEVLINYQNVAPDIFKNNLNHLTYHIIKSNLAILFFRGINSSITLWKIFNNDQSLEIFNRLIGFLQTNSNQTTTTSTYSSNQIIAYTTNFLLNVFDQLTSTQQQTLAEHFQKLIDLPFSPNSPADRLIDCLIKLPQEYPDLVKMKKRAIELVAIYCRCCQTFEELHDIEKQLEKYRKEGKLNHLAKRLDLQFGWLSVPLKGNVKWHQWLDDQGKAYECSGTWTKIMKIVLDYVKKISETPTEQEQQFLSITGSGCAKLSLNKHT